ncbi:MAG: folate-binding protein YgfZ [Elainellaceae cyanobacterium]
MQGATFTTVAAKQVPTSFANEAKALESVNHGVALVDRSHWGRIEVAGADRLRFLHNQSTNNFQILQPGQGCDTVFVNSTARTIDLVSAYVLEDAVLLLASPGYSQKLMQWMDRFIFFADKVELKDVTESTATFSLLGPKSEVLLEQLGAGAIVGQPSGSHALLHLQGGEIRVAVGSGLAIPGYTLITNVEQAASLWKMLSEAGAIPSGEQLWERLRIEQGRPMPDQELTEDVNPLEAGLWHTISLSKGCYIGQETIARLHTYRGVKQQLWGIRLEQAAAPETPVMAGEEKIGKLTSCTQTEQGYWGLAYIRTKAISPGLKVKVGESTGELVPAPFISHEYP